MNNQNGENITIDWEAIYLQLYAYTDSLLKSKSWFRGKKINSFKAGKQVHDYISEAIEKHLTDPEKFDVSSNRSLANYLKLHIIRTLVGNDAKSSENRTSKDVFATADQKEQQEEDSGSYLDAILPHAEVYFDQEIDYNEIMSSIETEVKGDKIAEEIFLGVCCCNLKRREVIEEFKMTENDFDNGMRRLKTILHNTSKKYDLNKQSA